jgi:hypothetical protein
MVRVRLRDLGEHEATRLLTERLLSANWRCSSLPPGDDAACAGGQWESIEDYISRVSAAEFTHGICPECSRKIKRQIAEERKRSRLEGS